MRRHLLLLLALVVAAPAARAQDAPVHNLAAFDALSLPTPNTIRTGAGEPGPDYWQQGADYSIDVTLDPDRHRVSGTVAVTYTNNAPTPLGYLWLQLEQNLFRPGSRGALIQPADSRWRGAFPGGGYDLTRVEVVQNGRRYTPEHLVDDTRLRLDLAEPMPPGGSTVTVEIDFAFVVPEYGADRMGRLDVAQGTVYELAQWYPRMYVYDDLDGWNPLPYLGQGEFYLEYGTFDVAITVPRDFLVVGTGALRNPEEVYTETQRRRLAQARNSAETVMIRTREEVGRADSRPAGEGPLTWRFRAENVRDVAYGASQAFLLDAASWEDVLVMSAYPAEGLMQSTDDGPGWERATQYARHTMQYYSEQWYRYPYPVAVNVGGIVGGMEYPMVNFSSVRARGQGLFGVTDHEHGHNWFPMIVGSDERRYAWMDEGFNTFMNHYSNLAYYGEASTRAERTRPPYVIEQMTAESADQPILTFPDRIRRSGLGFLAYRKPGYGLILLRDYILGPERFDPAFRAYIDRWAYKHPHPADFFRTIEDVAGEDLDYFWRGWFAGTGTLDQAVAEVRETDGTTIVALENRDELLLPLTLQIRYEDGRTERRVIPVEAFATSDVFEAPVEGRVESVIIDPDGALPDVDRSNNAWTRGEGVTAPKGG